MLHSIVDALSRKASWGLVAAILGAVAVSWGFVVYMLIKWKGSRSSGG